MRLSALSRWPDFKEVVYKFDQWLDVVYMQLLTAATHVMKICMVKKME